VSDSTIAGSPAVYAQPSTSEATVLRSTLVGHGSSVVNSTKGALKLQDDLIDARDPGAGHGLTTMSYIGVAHTVDLRNVTLLGHGDDFSSRGLDVSSVGPGEVVTVTARDSVVTNFGSRALYRTGNDTTNLSLDHVDVFPASPVQESGPGSFTAADVTNADPAFGPDGFTPTAGSPLIDAGTPGPLDPSESPTDLLGNSRIVASGCGDPRRDLGAIEAPGGCVPTPDPQPQPQPQPQPAVVDSVAPTVTKVRLVHRRTVRFTVSEAARVTVRITRPHRRPVVVKRTIAAGAIKLKLKHALRRGRYAIRVVAVDAAGNRGTRIAKARVS
jgi:hypothetical protein